jgi:SAM-dependent methyltransferase
MYFDSKPLFVNLPIDEAIVSAENILNARAEAMSVFSAELNGKTVFDVGCCNGRFSAWCLDQGATHVHGLDIESSYITSAENIMPNYFTADKYTFEVGDINNYTPISTYDIVTLFSILYFGNWETQIEKACSMADTILIETSWSEYAPQEGIINKFNSLNYTLEYLGTDSEERVMFIAKKGT